MTTARTIVVIGCSSGGISALTRLICNFDPLWPVAVFVTIHIGSHGNMLPDVLNRVSPMPVTFAEDRDLFGCGRIYLAPPDRHLIIGAAKTYLGVGPKINHARPAIDPMFRSAAHSHRDRVTGLLLTGHLYDGVNGLAAVHSSGGCTIVQDPDDAEAPAIPRNALRRVTPHFVVPLRQIPAAMVQCFERQPLRGMEEAKHA